MSIVLDEDESFSMTGYFESAGPQRMILRGYITQRRSDGLYAAPLIPQLFYGANGAQLQSWRQDIPVAGSQTILSRSGGEPSVPREDLWWRKVSDNEPHEELAQTSSVPPLAEPTNALPLVIAVVGGIALLWFLSR